MSDTTNQENTQQGSQAQVEANNQQTAPESQNNDMAKNFEALRKAKEVSDKKLAQYQAKEVEAEKQKLEEEGKYKELIEKERKEKEEILTKYQSEKRQVTLEKELSKEGINNELLDLIMPSILSRIEFNAENQPVNLTEVIEDLKKSKPSLFINPTAKPAGKVGTNITNNTSTGIDESKLGDIEYVKNNLETILEQFTK